MRATSASIDVITQTFVGWWDEWVNLWVLNLAWVLCWLTIVLGPPATLGLYYVTNRLAHGESLGLSGFLDGGRRYFFLSWLWMLINLVVAIVISANFWFYASFESIWMDFLQAFFVILGIIWLIVQFYALPYLMEQESKHLGIALRNGLYTALAAPGFTLVVAGVGALIVGLSVVLVFPLFLGVPCLVILLGNRAVIERLGTYQVREKEAGQVNQDHKET